MGSVVTIILGGGAGSRLYPLTKDRSKPAVPLAGKYRLIDIPISSSIRAGYNRVFILTQYNAESLNRHIKQSYNFDQFSDGFVDILAAEQRADSVDWYHGTADAVRRSMVHIQGVRANTYLVLAADHLYNMDFREMVRFHEEKNADVTLVTLLVSRDRVAGLGIVQVDKDYRITRFTEKPKDPAVVDSLALQDGQFLASMGIYVFKRAVMTELMQRDHQDDFGRDIIPGALTDYRIFAFPYSGYWEDIGTMRAFFEANMDLTSKLPKFDFYSPDATIFTHPRFLPATKIQSSMVDRAILADGCVIEGATIRHAIIGIRSLIRDYVFLEDVIMMGADYFEEHDPEGQSREGIPPIGLGKGCRIRGAILDKNVRIGENVVLENTKEVQHFDSENLYIREGVIVVPKNGIIPSHTTLDDLLAAQKK